MPDLRYPIGPAPNRPSLDPGERRAMIAAIAAAPALLRAAAGGLDDGQLDTPYRDGGWTVRQVVHHVPDSHINAYTRLKFALTESEPVIKPYDENAWARTAEVERTPVAVSLALLDALHTRWVVLLESLGEREFARTFRHPDHGVVTLDWFLALYAWHGRHHASHVTTLRQRMGW